MSEKRQIIIDVWEAYSWKRYRISLNVGSIKETLVQGNWSSDVYDAEWGRAVPLCMEERGLMM